MKVQTGKTLNKPKPPVLSYQPHSPALLRPHVQPFPKPGVQGQGQGLTESELADYARRIAFHNNEIVKLKDQEARHRNEILRYFHLITVGSDLEASSIGICGLCGFAHEGECLDA